VDDSCVSFSLRWKGHDIRAHEEDVKCCCDTLIDPR